MSDAIRLKSTSDNKELIKSLDAAQKRMLGLEKQLEKTSAKSKKLTAEQRAMARHAKKAFEEAQSPLQRYENKMKRLERAFKKGAITQREFEAGSKKLKRELHQTQGGFSMVAKASETAFNPMKLTAFAGGIVSVSALLKKATDLLNEMDEASRRAFDQAKEARPGMAELAGLAKTPEEAQKLVTKARKAYDTGVGKTEEEAAGIHYKLKSAGLYEEREVFEELSRSGAIRDVIPTVGATARIQSAMGKAETGDAMAVMSKLYQASDVTQYTVPEIGAAAAEPALYAGRLGMKDEELLAQLAAAMQVSDPGKSGTQATAFYSTLLEKGGFKGLSAEQMMTKVGETLAPMSEADQKKWFGRKEGQTFYQTLLTNQETFRQQMQALPEAEQMQLARVKASLPDVDSLLGATRSADEAKRSSAAEDRGAGEARALVEAVFAERDTAIKEKMPGRVGQAFSTVGRSIVGLVQRVAGDEAVLENTMVRDAELSPELRGRITRHKARAGMGEFFRQVKRKQEAEAEGEPQANPKPMVRSRSVPVDRVPAQLQQPMPVEPGQHYHPARDQAPAQLIADRSQSPVAPVVDAAAGPVGQRIMHATDASTTPTVGEYMRRSRACRSQIRLRSSLTKRTEMGYLVLVRECVGASPLQKNVFAKNWRSGLAAVMNIRSIVIMIGC